MTLLVEALAVLTLVASQPPPKLDVAPGATQQHGPVLPGIAGLGKKNPNQCFDWEELLFQGEEGKKSGSAKSLAARWCGE